MQEQAEMPELVSGEELFKGAGKSRVSVAGHEKMHNVAAEKVLRRLTCALARHVC